MSERVYLWFLSFNFVETTDRRTEDPGFWDTWLKKKDEILAKNGVELLVLGEAYGIVENMVLILKTEMDIVELGKVQGEIRAIDRKIINYGRTITIIPV